MTDQSMQPKPTIRRTNCTCC